MKYESKYPKRRFPWYRVIPTTAILLSAGLIAFGVAKQSYPDLIAGWWVLFAAKVRDIY